MIEQISLSAYLIDALYKAKEIQDTEYQETLEWITDIIENENRLKVKECEICPSNKKLEQHHVRGSKHGNECITVCQECHNTLTDRQRLWEGSWLGPDSNNKDAFLIRGIIDVCELKYQKTGIEIFRLFSEKLTEGFSYELYLCKSIYRKQREKLIKEPENHNANIRFIFDTETTKGQYQNLTLYCFSS